MNRQKNFFIFKKIIFMLLTIAGLSMFSITSYAEQTKSVNSIEQLLQGHSWQSDEQKSVYTTDGRYFIYDEKNKLSDYGSVIYKANAITIYSANSNSSGTFQVKVNSTNGNIDLIGSITTDMLTSVTTPVKISMQPLKNKISPPIVANIFDAATYGDNAYINKFTGDINQKDKKGNTPLIFASASPFYTTVTLLLEKGAKVNVVSANGKSPLILAVNEGQLQSVTSLIKAGANINFQTKNQRTPISEAAASSNLEILKLLVNSGANLKVVVEGQNILEIAMYRIGGGATGFSDNLIFTQYLVEDAKFKVNDYLDGKNQTALYLAVTLVMPKTVHYLLSQGANPNFQDSDKETPLTFAIQQDQRTFVNNVKYCNLPDFLEIMKDLHAHGAVLSLKNSDGQNALSLAQAGGCTKLTNLIKSLQH